MAVQVGISEQSASRFAAPHLYVIDLEQAAEPGTHPSILTRRQAIRRRRHLRRVRQAAEAAGWAAGSLVLIALVLAGMVGLR